MKKIISLLLALVMVLSLAACGAKEEAPAETQAAAAPEAPAADKIVLNVVAAQYGGKTAASVGFMDRFIVFDNGHSEEKMAVITAFIDFFYEDKRYSDWVIMEDFLPATTTGGGIMVAANPDAAAWLDVVGGAKFYPTAKAEWADVKQGVIDVQQEVLLGGDAQALLDDLQAEIAG